MKDLYVIWVMSRLAVVDYVLFGISFFSFFFLFMFAVTEGFDEVDKRVVRWIKILAVYTLFFLIAAVLLPSPKNLREYERQLKTESVR